jgi:HK97 family phage portal protein
MYAQQRAGVPVTVHTALQVDSVYTALRVISNAIIKMGNPRAYQVDLDANNEPYRSWLPNQPGLLTNTWGELFQFDGMTRTVMSMGLFGEAFWYILERDYLQRATALEVLNPAFVEVRGDRDNPGRVLYLYGTGSEKRRLANEDVVHVPFMAMPGALRGLNSIEYAGVAYALALAAMEYGQRWFAQGASPSYLLTTDQKLGQEEVKRIAQKFLIDHSGLQAAHLPLVLDSGMKAEKIQSTPDEAQYLGTLEYARSVIAAWFGLPPHLVGGANEKGNVWGKTVQEQGIQMVDYTLSGYIVRLNEAFSSLLPRGTYAAFNESSITRASADELAKEIVALRTTGVETANEIRVGKLHKPPLPGGDMLMTPLNTNTGIVTGQVYADEAAQVDDSITVPVPTKVDAGSDPSGDNDGEV